MTKEQKKNIYSSLKMDVQRVIYPMAQIGEHVFSPDPRILELGFEPMERLPASKHDFRNGDNSDFVEALQTTNGGGTWSQVFRRSQPVPVVRSSEKGVIGYATLFPNFVVARFIGRDRIILAKDDGVLMVSDDHGARWNLTHLPHGLDACRPYRDDLVCAAGDKKGFWIVRISADD